jgi:cytoskeletal protein RodZ
VYRSNHFESQNVGQGLAVGQGLSSGQGLADDQSSVQTQKQQMSFNSGVQATEPNGYNHHPDVHHTQVPHSHTQVSHSKAPPSKTPLSLAARMEQQQYEEPRQPVYSVPGQQNLVNNGHPPLPPIAETPHIQNDQRSIETQAQSHARLDPQISALFTAMGQASQLSHSQLAARLQTSPNLITALENGSLNELPQWEEIEPVITRYAEFMNIDDRAILRRLREQLTEHYLTNMTADQQPNMNSIGSFQQETPPPLTSEHSQNGASIMPSSDVSLKAFASGNLTSSEADRDQFNRQRDMNSVHGLNNQSLEERFTALTSAVTESQNSSHIIAQNQSTISPLDTRSAIAGVNTNAPHQMNSFAHNGQMNTHGNQPHTGAMRQHEQSQHTQAQHVQAQHANYTNPNFLNTAHQQDSRVPVALGQSKTKPKSKWLRIFGNFALVMILLVGFINWQPNRFWSGVDQLPKPISKSIYTLFEFVMPDPLASVYRMNWVHVADPRMRKADKLAVPTVRKLPRIDFSKLGSFNN